MGLLELRRTPVTLGNDSKHLLFHRQGTANDRDQEPESISYLSYTKSTILTCNLVKYLFLPAGIVHPACLALRFTKDGILDWAESCSAVSETRRWHAQGSLDACQIFVEHVCANLAVKLAIANSSSS